MIWKVRYAATLKMCKRRGLYDENCVMMKKNKGVRVRARNKDMKNCEITFIQEGMPQNSAEQHTPCPLYRRCGGCQLQNMSYARQLQWKQSKVERLFEKYHRVDRILGMQNPYHYRCKVQAAFAQDRAGRVISGVYQSSTHHVVPVERCMTEDETADRIIGTIRGLCKSFRITPYDERSGTGLLRHVLVKRSFSTGQVMVVLVTTSPILPAKNRFIKALREEYPEITTVVLNINNRSTSMVLGEDERILFGPGVIEDRLCGLVFRISAQSFYQINPVQTEVLYNKAIEFAQLSGRETVFDAYCGVGTIGLVASSRASRVIGVELNRSAVRNAIANARTNGITNARFYAGDADEFLTDMAEEGERADVVLMDPPRAGSDQRFLTSLIRMAPERVVYISCNPDTQLRDIEILMRGGYHVQAVQPVDMFPHTNHVESIVLLSKLHTRQNIEVELEMSELDLTAAESKATYEVCTGTYGIKG
jgi:23S rRNA (uracil1939-C5)-methyltransferase